MTRVGEMLMEFLRSRSDVMCVRVLSVSSTTVMPVDEAIGLRYGGAGFTVMVTRDGAWSRW